MFHTANEELPFAKTRMSLLHDTDDQYLATSQRLFAITSHHINWRTGFGKIMIKVDWNQKVPINDGVFQWWSFTNDGVFQWWSFQWSLMCASMMFFFELLKGWLKFMGVTMDHPDLSEERDAWAPQFSPLAPGDRKESKELPAPWKLVFQKGKKSSHHFSRGELFVLRSVSCFLKVRFQSWWFVWWPKLFVADFLGSGTTKMCARAGLNCHDFRVTRGETMINLSTQ